MTEATTWEQGCEDATNAIYNRIQHGGVDYRRSTPTEAIKVLRAELALHPVTATAQDGAQFIDFASMGAVATYCSTKIYRDGSIAFCQRRIEKLLAAKQHDYGHGNIERFGLLGIVVRISDKLARLENLYGRIESASQSRDVDVREGEQALNESIADTWDDIVGYCVIALMVLDDTFKLELEDDIEERKLRDAYEPPDQQTGLPGGSMYCIDDLGNVYHRREDGSWAYQGQGTLSVLSAPEPAWTMGLEGPKGAAEWVGTPYEYNGPTPVTFADTGRKS